MLAESLQHKWRENIYKIEWINPKCKSEVCVRHRKFLVLTEKLLFLSALIWTIHPFEQFFNIL